MKSHIVSYTRRNKLLSIFRMKRKGYGKSLLTREPTKHVGNNIGFTSHNHQSFVSVHGGRHFSLSHDDNEKARNHGSVTRKQKNIGCKRKKENIVQDEVSHLQSRARYLLVKMKLEQNLIDAYSGEGWKGQSREKIKPEKELERAVRQILKCKLGIRDAIHQLDILSSEGRIGDTVMFPDGSIFHEHIFCAICKSCEASQDNDIILCDGACNCGFHQKCLEPPLLKIPPGDQGWLCKYCECKMEILEAVNAHISTCFSVNSKWEDVFKEATVGSDDEKKILDKESEWPSEDSEDGDYDPDTSTQEYMSDSARSFTSSFCSSDHASSLSGKYINYDDGGSSNKSGNTDSGESKVRSLKRQRRHVDYTKLYHEMFGKKHEDEQQSEDEDWGPYKKKRKGSQSECGTALASCCEKDSGLELASTTEVKKKMNSVLNNRKALFRIPSAAVEKLRQVFDENELPSRIVKENLSRQLGITLEKVFVIIYDCWTCITAVTKEGSVYTLSEPEVVNKWFKNARYAALRFRKAEDMICPSNHHTRRHYLNDGAYDGLKCHTPSAFLRIDMYKNTFSKSSKPVTVPVHQKRTASRHLIDVVEANMRLKRKKYHIENTSIELKRLCSLEDRLDKLKLALNSCRNQCNASIKNYSSGRLVIYVPILEVKEKV